MELLEGSIADNFDPENWGRVRVNLFGKTESLSTEELPFARVVHPLSSKLALSDDTCEVGTRVLILKINDDWNSLVILGQQKHKSQTP